MTAYLEVVLAAAVALPIAVGLAVLAAAVADRKPQPRPLPGFRPFHGTPGLNSIVLYADEGLPVAKEWHQATLKLLARQEIPFLEAPEFARAYLTAAQQAARSRGLNAFVSCSSELAGGTR